MYVNPSPAERLILENQQVIMRALRCLLIHDNTGIMRSGAAAVENQMGRNAAGLKLDHPDAQLALMASEDIAREATEPPLPAMLGDNWRDPRTGLLWGLRNHTTEGGETHSVWMRIAEDDRP